MIFLSIQVPSQQCQSVPNQMEKMECRSIPREQCSGGAPRQECETVPRMQCGDPICQPVYWCRRVITGIL